MAFRLEHRPIPCHFSHVALSINFFPRPHKLSMQGKGKAMLIYFKPPLLGALAVIAVMTASAGSSQPGRGQSNGPLSVPRPPGVISPCALPLPPSRPLQSIVCTAEPPCSAPIWSLSSKTFDELLGRVIVKLSKTLPKTAISIGEDEAALKSNEPLPKDSGGENETCPYLCC